MTTHVAFLRSINVGGRRVTNEALREAVSALGFHDVATYRASGNVLLSTDDDDKVRARLEAGLRAALGFDVPVILRSGEQVAALAAHAPFPPDAVAQTAGKLQVMLTSAPPSEDARSRVLALATGDDRLAFFGGDLFWLPREGVSTSALNFGAIERIVGLNTVRTVGTLAGIVRKIRL